MTSAPVSKLADAAEVAGHELEQFFESLQERLAADTQRALATALAELREASADAFATLDMHGKPELCALFDEFAARLAASAANVEFPAILRAAAAFQAVTACELRILKGSVG